MAEPKKSEMVEVGLTTTKTRVEYQVWVEMPDGEVGQAYFASTSPEIYDTATKAANAALRYNEEQVGWKKPLPHKRFFVRAATVTTTTTYEPPLCLPPERTETDE